MRGLLGALVAASTLCACAPSPPERPSFVLFILVDTFRQDHLSCYGSETPTPNIDRLAARGRLYTQAVASFHQTTMSMGALFTGRAPSIESDDPAKTLHWNGRTWCGLARLTRPDVEDLCIPRALPTLGESMRAAGYRTIGVVSNELLFRPSGFERGFDEWIEVVMTGGESLPDRNMWRILARKAEHVNARALEALPPRPTEPTFLYLHYVDVHDWHLYQRPYAEVVTDFDRDLGLLLDALEERGYLENAAIVLTSDHGEALDESHAVSSLKHHSGNPSFDPVLRIPLIVASPTLDDSFPEASSTIRTQDVGSLLRRLVGRPDPGPRDLEPDEVFLTELFFQTYRRGKWKITRDRRDGRVLLFDLEQDPGETRDAAADHPEQRAALESRMDELADALAAKGSQPATLSPVDRERLKALGYLE